MDTQVKKQFSDFKKFILRGNVVDLAVAVVIGAAFNNIVQALVKDFITPLIGMINGKEQLASGSFVLRGQTFNYGDFINVLVSFLTISAVIFFLVVQPLNKFMAHVKPADEVDKPSERQCPACLSAIPSAATRCKFCTTKFDTPSPAAKKPLGSKA
jgi:large conductance mechanosensitive channel